MFTERYSYPDRAVPLALTDRPFFLTTKISMPAISEKGGRLEAKIYKYWNLAEAELFKMSQNPEGAKPFQALLHISSAGGTISLKDVSDSFEDNFCYPDNVRKARVAINVGTQVSDKWEGNMRWKFTEVELAQLLVAVVARRKFKED